MNESQRESGAMLKFGTVSAIDPAKCRARVRLPDYENLRTAWLPVLQSKTLRDKHYHLPDIGEQVCVLLDGQGEAGVIIGAVYSNVDRPPVASADKHHVRFDDGASIEYDRARHQLTVTGGVEKIVVETGREILLKAGMKVTVDAPDTEFSGNVTIMKKLTYLGGLSGTGQAEMTGGMTMSGGDVIVDGISAKTHTHPDAHGGDTGSAQSQ